MDDVVLIADNPIEMQNMLDITDHVSKIYHIEYGKEKSKAMKIGKKAMNYKLKLGELKLEYTDNYKYLGNTINKTSTMQDQINQIKAKTEGAYQMVLKIGRDANFKG